MEVLKSCPFCGGEAEILKYPRCERKYVVVCKNNLCNASIGQYSTSKENAVRAWNTRKSMEAVVTELNETGRKFCENVGCSKECENCEHGALMRTIIEIVRGKE